MDAASLIPVAFLVLGLAAGMLYFASLWWTSQRLAQSGLTPGSAAMICCRMAVLGAALFLASRHGALALLMMALGIFAGRAVVMRRARILP